MQRNLTPRKAESRFYSRLTCAPSPNISPTVRSMKMPPQGTRTCIELFVSTEVSTSLSQSWAEQSSMIPQPHLLPARKVKGQLSHLYVGRWTERWSVKRTCGCDVRGLRLSPFTDTAITLMCSTSVARPMTANPPPTPRDDNHRYFQNWMIFIFTAGRANDHTLPETMGPVINRCLELISQSD